MATTPAPKDSKYIVFKRNEFFEMMGQLALPPFPGGGAEGQDCAPIAQHVIDVAEKTCVEDAIVIRRQDAFAPPALDAYANAITTSIQLDLVVNGGNKHPAVTRLKEIADYFHD